MNSERSGQRAAFDLQSAELKAFLANLAAAGEVPYATQAGVEEAHEALVGQRLADQVEQYLQERT